MTLSTRINTQRRKPVQHSNWRVRDTSSNIYGSSQFSMGCGWTSYI
jgi:hypothetical protein